MVPGIPKARPERPSYRNKKAGKAPPPPLCVECGSEKVDTLPPALQASRWEDSLRRDSVDVPEHREVATPRQSEVQRECGVGPPDSASARKRQKKRQRARRSPASERQRALERAKEAAKGRHNGPFKVHTSIKGRQRAPERPPSRQSRMTRTESDMGGSESKARGASTLGKTVVTPTTI